MPGAVVIVAVAEGERVEAGAVLITLEAMKMEHVVRAPAAGTVREVRVAVGDQVDTGDVLVVIETDDGREDDDAPSPGGADGPARRAESGPG